MDTGDLLKIIDLEHIRSALLTTCLIFDIGIDRPHSLVVTTLDSDSNSPSSNLGVAFFSFSTGSNCCILMDYIPSHVGANSNL